MRFVSTLILVSVAGILLAATAPETLTLKDFTDGSGKAPGGGWSTETGGMIHLKGKGGNLITRTDYTNFVLEWDWKVIPGGNNGVKYWVTDVSGAGEWLGIEYQMIDDAKNEDGLRGGSHTTASFYDIQEPEPGKTLNPAGEWNASRVVVKDGVLEHWLNGKRVGTADTRTDDWRRRVAASKFRDKKGFAPGHGRIMLTDHQDETWFRNLRVTVLP
jgi:Domain of Unknown Function (DUF1080)